MKFTQLLVLAVLLVSGGSAEIISVQNHSSASDLRRLHMLPYLPIEVAPPNVAVQIAQDATLRVGLAGYIVTVEYWDADHIFRVASERTWVWIDELSNRYQTAYVIVPVDAITLQRVYITPILISQWDRVEAKLN